MTLYEQLQKDKEGKDQSAGTLPLSLKVVMFLKKNPLKVAIAFIGWLIFSIFTNIYFIIKFF